MEQSNPGGPAGDRRRPGGPNPIRYMHRLFIASPVPLRQMGREDLLNVLYPSPPLRKPCLRWGLLWRTEIRSFNNRSGWATGCDHRAGSVPSPPANPLQPGGPAGVLCKPPVLRRTPLGRDIFRDLLLAVNRRYRRADYLPCTPGEHWPPLQPAGDGDPLWLDRRLQSRTYLKTVGERPPRSARPLRLHHQPGLSQTRRRRWSLNRPEENRKPAMGFSIFGFCSQLSS